jgi:hypothetical protein
MPKTIASRLVLLTVLSFLAAGASGCISTSRTVRREEPRMQVDFENDTAGRLFYESLSHLRSHRGASESHSHVSLPIIFDHQNTTIEGESIVFNEAVRRCDTNHDGKITELEARIFSEQYPKP